MKNLLVDDDLRFFEENGYIKINDNSLGELWDRCEREVSALFDFFVGKDIDIHRHGYDKVDKKTQSLIYDRLSYLPCLAALCSDTRILQYCIELGISFPILMGCSNMRYDRPEDQQHLFKWHQDSLYLLGSLNAVTIWIPFSKVNRHHGSIAVLPGSHKNGIRKFKKTSEKLIQPDVQFLQRDLQLDEEVDETDMVIIEADRGDLVIFSQMLLHKSVPNQSDKVRWSAQLRIADLQCQNYLKNNFQNGDKHNVFTVDYPGFKYDYS